MNTTFEKKIGTRGDLLNTCDGQDRDENSFTNATQLVQHTEGDPHSAPDGREGAQTCDESILCSHPRPGMKKKPL